MVGWRNREEVSVTGTEGEREGREIGEVSRSQIWKDLVAHNKENWFYFP